MKLFCSAIAKFLLGAILVGVLVFLPAGTLDFGYGWLFMGILFLPMLVAGLIPSKGEGRRLVQQVGVSIDGNKVTDFNMIIDESIFNDNEIIIKKGQKVFHKIILK